LKSENGHNPEVKVAEPPVKRFRASGPILFIAILFVVGAFLTWYLTWFGRELTDADITTYLAENKPRKVQHALLKIQERLERRDPNAKQWYPQIVSLAGNPETDIRLTVAWVMGFDNQSSQFHQSLLKLLKDSEPIVRRNAALALVRHNDSRGRQELLSIFAPYVVTAPADGVLTSSLKIGSGVARGSLLARIRKDNYESAELRSPLRGEVQNLTVQSAGRVSSGQAVVELRADEESVWEALRALALIGEPGDAAMIQQYVQQNPQLQDRVREQAAQTIKAIQGRQK
jgi:hypothetical protein